MPENLHPHPGLILKCRLREKGIPFFDLGERVDFDENKLKDVIDMKRPMCLLLCEKLSRFFGDELSFWIKLQINYELSLVAYETSYPKDIEIDPMQSPLPDRFG
ncbi:hypothetical protein F3J37_01275 [Pantoea sp. Al-1710]|uniref:Uncharacterized protein n=1 Tax=Candidatus Pantoea communis TaxID=2608354 RepID=A0ABX0RJU0_9GAMM|nr:MULTISPECIES: hypothetical protein [Pantoea]NIG12991.1 hypothetical protein [Pantoea sp. Cy-640]NIG17308.1 hypothetical protein [Pantoea communis]